MAASFFAAFNSNYNQEFKFRDNKNAANFVSNVRGFPVDFERRAGLTPTEKAAVCKVLGRVVLLMGVLLGVQAGK